MQLPRFTRCLTTPAMLCGLLLAGVITGGCASDKAVMDQATQFDQGLRPAEVQAPEVTNYFQQLGMRIIDSAKQADAQKVGPKTHFDKSESEDWMFSNKIQFHLVNSKTLNAFTTGGEHVYVYNELLQDCKNEDELAAVMAHEFGHIYSRHVQKGMTRNIYAMIGAGAAGAAGYVAGGKEHGSEYATAGASAGMAAGQFLNMGFTRKDEAEADQWGFWFYTRGGWDPQQFAGFFQTMISKGLDTATDTTSDHPTLASRVKAAQERVKSLPPASTQWRKQDIVTQAQFDHIKSVAQQAAATTPDDKSLQNSKQLLQALPRSCITPQTPADQQQAAEVVADRVNQSQKRK